MSAPHSFENTLRVHDVAFFNWLGGLRVDYGTVGGEDRSNFPILRVFASPERAFARLLDVLVRLCWIDGATAQAMRDNTERFAVLPLPIATIQRGDPVPDPELRGTPKDFRTRWLNLSTGQWERHPFPAHYRTPYTVTFWMPKRYTEAYIREWIMAQFGRKGVAENEALIDVVHDQPWGLMPQALRFDGSSDLSDLEGEEPRWVRFEFTFNLRTWFFRVVEPSEDDVQAIGFDTLVESTRPPETAVGGEDSQGPTPELVQSENLHVLRVPPFRIPQVMPTTGNATVQAGVLAPPGKRSERGDLNLQVAVQADTVEMGEWPLVTDAEGVAIYGYNFEYLSKVGRVEMEVLQRETVAAPATPDVIVSADSFVLPQTKRWERFHRFTVVRGANGPAAVADRTTLITRFAGIPNQPPQDFHLHHIGVRRLVSGTKVPATAQVAGAGETIYQWTGLARRPYLVIIILATTSGGSGIVTVEDDLATPTVQTQRELDATVNAGAAFLIQPDRDALALHVPNAITVEDVYIQTFGGWYAGHTVGF